MTRHAPALAFTLTCAVAGAGLGTWFFAATTVGGLAAIPLALPRFIFTLLACFTALILLGGLPFAALRRRAGPTPTTTNAAIGGSALCAGALLILSLVAGVLPTAFEFGLTALSGGGLGALYLWIERALSAEE